MSLELFATAISQASHIYEYNFVCLYYIFYILSFINKFKLQHIMLITTQDGERYTYTA